MAASYSSFLATQYYSPVFNTALFDGPFRIYFSQSYESVALKVYHLLQTQHLDLWTQYKKWSEQTKNHAFLLIYPTQKDVHTAFNKVADSPLLQKWDDGVLIGLENPDTEADFQHLFNQVVVSLQNFSENFIQDDFKI